MSTEEIIVEILHNAHAKGIRLQVLEKVLSLMNANANLSRVDAYEMAYQTISNQ